jgi:hypothetical protein
MTADRKSSCSLTCATLQVWKKPAVWPIARKKTFPEGGRPSAASWQAAVAPTSTFAAASKRESRSLLTLWETLDIRAGQKYLSDVYALTWRGGRSSLLENPDPGFRCLLEGRITEGCPVFLWDGCCGGIRSTFSAFLGEVPSRETLTGTVWLKVPSFRLME